MLLVCICFQGRLFAIDKPIGAHFPEEDYFSISQDSIISCNSLCKLKPPELYCTHISLSVGVVWITVSDISNTGDITL